MVRTRSYQVPGRHAPSTPTAIPDTAAKHIAASASRSVAGKRSARSRAMGRRVM
jgi:hypothetical protein